jgi:hypothetical protein
MEKSYEHRLFEATTQQDRVGILNMYFVPMSDICTVQTI